MAFNALQQRILTAVLSVGRERTSRSQLMLLILQHDVEFAT
jgi:hypothetical protein